MVRECPHRQQSGGGIGAQEQGDGRENTGRSGGRDRTESGGDRRQRHTDRSGRRDGSRQTGGMLQHFNYLPDRHFDLYFLYIYYIYITSISIPSCFLSPSTQVDFLIHLLAKVEYPPQGRHRHSPLMQTSPSETSGLCWHTEAAPVRAGAAKANTKGDVS